MLADIFYRYIIFGLIAAIGTVRLIKMIPERDSSTGDTILQHSLVRKRLTVLIHALSLVFIVGGSIAAVFTDPYYTPKLSDIPSMIPFLLFFLAVWVLIITLDLTETYGTSYRITDEGITKKVWSSTELMQWSDINKVHFKGLPGERGFVFRASKNKIKIETNLQGLKMLAREIKDHMPVEKWKSAGKAIADILAR